MRRAPTLLVVVLLAGCTNEVDPAWQLDHDRVIAVRATPPRILPGEVATILALLGHKGQAPDEVQPATAEVVSPTSLADALGHDATGTTVTAPSADRLAAARSELGLAAGDAVPLRLRVTFSPSGMVAYKIVGLGEHADNPVLAPIVIDGMDASSATELTVAAGVDVRVAVMFDETYDVNWLTSCGTMHDFDLAKAYLRVEPADPHTGSFAVVVRDRSGGVAWHVWPITSPSP